MRWWIWGPLAACLLALAGGAPARAAEGPGVGLTLTPSATRYAADAPVVLRMTVTNRTSGGCLLAATARGTVAVSVTRDGERVSPSFGYSGSSDGQTAFVLARSRTVPPGGRVDFALTAVPWAGGQVLSSVAPVPGETGLASLWPVHQAGRYAVTAHYQMPEQPGVCPGTSGTATASFTVAGAPPTRPIVLGAAALLLLIVIVVVVLLLRRRRGAALVVLLVLGTAAAQLVPARPAAAKVAVKTNGSTEYPGFEAAVTKCLGEIRSLAGTADPEGIMKFIDGDFPVLIVPIPKSEGIGGDGIGNQVTSVVRWRPDFDGLLSGTTVKNDPCSTLFHELTHVYDLAHDQYHPETCQYQGPDGKPVTGPSVIEVRASRAENRYRAAKGLVARSKYGGLPLPPGTNAKLDQVKKDCMSDRPPTPIPITGAHGGTDGDPHLLTFDGRRYDFQAVGEFVLAKADGLEVQVRQSPMEGSRYVAVNTAAGMRVGADRLGFARYDGSLEVRLNGRPADATTHALPAGGTLDLSGGEYTVTWPDGSKATVAPIGGWGLRVMVYPAEGRKGTLTGLLGNFNGDPADDLTTGAGKRLGDAPARGDLYGAFADSWRITQATSLLDYPAGRTTASYTDKSFPDKIVTADDLDPAARDAARRMCAALGVTAPEALRACVLDVAVTGQPIFAAGAQDTAQRTGEAAGGQTAGQPLRDGSVVRETIGAAGEVDTYPLDLGDTTVVRLYDVTGDQGLQVTLDGPDASASPGFTVTSNYQWRVVRGASYTLKISRANGATGPYGFRLVTAKERRLPVALDTAVNGSLDVPGRVDLLAFTPSRAGRLYLADPKGCELSVSVVDDTPQPRVFSPAGVCYGIDLATLVPGKPYLLIVWSGAGRTGPYSFRMALR